MKVLYIGQYTKGTTSRMRALSIKHILDPEVFKVVDTNIPFFKTNQIFRSLGFRFKIGPLISKTNTFIKSNIEQHHYDLIWVDKAVYINHETTKYLKGKTKKLVHYTPDMAFYMNKSKAFENSLPYYDFCITTKTAEKAEYLKLVSEDKLILTTQGFSKNIHKPYCEFENKDNSVVFIGLGEPHRFEVIRSLLKAGIKIKLVGKNWGQFLKANKNLDSLDYLGESIYDEEYSKLISSSMFALGLLSKRFPEYHTTRTFEIPACGTALLTERNKELQSFYADDEVAFYLGNKELVTKVKYYFDNKTELKLLTEKGTKRVMQGGYDYESILRKILKKVL